MSRATPAQKDLIQELLNELGEDVYGGNLVMDQCEVDADLENLDELTREQASEAIAALKEEKHERKRR